MTAASLGCSSVARTCLFVFTTLCVTRDAAMANSVNGTPVNLQAPAGQVDVTALMDLSSENGTKKSLDTSREITPALQFLPLRDPSHLRHETPQLKSGTNPTKLHALENLLDKHASDAKLKQKDDDDDGRRRHLEEQEVPDAEASSLAELHGLLRWHHIPTSTGTPDLSGEAKPTPQVLARRQLFHGHHSHHSHHRHHGHHRHHIHTKIPTTTPTFYPTVLPSVRAIASPCHTGLSRAL